MTKTDKIISEHGAINGTETGLDENGKPLKLNETDSIYRGIILACLRSKQLIKGAVPRVTQVTKHKNKNTTIAIEEVKKGLIIFEIIPEDLT